MVQAKTENHKMVNPDKKQLNLKPTVMCVCHCARLSYTTQHRTVLINFPLILQTIIIAQMMSTRRQRRIHQPQEHPTGN